MRPTVSPSGPLLLEVAAIKVSPWAPPPYYYIKPYIPLKSTDLMLQQKQTLEAHLTSPKTANSREMFQIRTKRPFTMIWPSNIC